MPIKVDGTNGVLQAYDYQVLTTGFSYTFAAGTQTLIANPAGTLATGTVTMPASPADGMVITVQSSQQVTALTVQGNTGQSLVGGTSQLIPNQPLSFVYRLANTTWYPMAGGAGRATALVSGTSQNSTSGTSIDFTGIPSWVKRITVILNGVSLSGTANFRFQLGTSAGIVSTGYVGAATNIQNANATNGAVYAGGGFDLTNNANLVVQYGTLRIVNITGNTWVADGVFSRTTAANGADFTAGTVVLSGTLDRVRVTSTGADTFDAGSINILYE